MLVASLQKYADAIERCVKMPMPDTGFSLRAWLIVGAVIAVCAAVGAIYAKGRLDESSASTIQQQSKTIEPYATGARPMRRSMVLMMLACPQA